MRSSELDRLEKALREHFTELDIRSDQCDTVRIITPTLTAGCTCSDGHYCAKVISMEGDFDFETQLLANLVEDSPEGLVMALQEYF